MRVWRHLERRREARRIAEDYARSDMLILTCLPREDDGQPLPAAVIADRTGLATSRVYARLLVLERDGLVESPRTGTVLQGDPIPVYLPWQLTDDGCVAAERAAGYDHRYKVDVNSAYGKLGQCDV